MVWKKISQPASDRGAKESPGQENRYPGTLWFLLERFAGFAVPHQTFANFWNSGFGIVPGAKRGRLRVQYVTPSRM